jgi:acyl-CoA synthetase (NDP forming)
LIGGGYGNPIDTGNQNRIQMARIMDILGRDANIDSVVVLNMIRFFFQLPGAIEAGIEMMVNARNRYGKPVVAIIIYTTPNEMQRAREATKKLQEQGIAAFPSIERGALALRNALEYYRLKKRITD